MNNKIVSHVYTRAIGTMLQLKDGRFKQIREGGLKCLMTGYDYVLVKNDLASLIQSIGINGVKFVPAKVLDSKAGLIHQEYLQMLVSKEFKSEEVYNLPLDKEQFFLMNKKYLFATPKLVEKLKNSGFDLKFSLGLSDFG